MLKRQQGLSLVELMITITLGLLLMAALTAVFSNTLGVNSRSLQLSQMQEEATTVMDLIVGDLRRAGYRGDAAMLVYDPTNASDEFNDSVAISSFAGEQSDSCIVFRYDENGNGSFEAADESFGYRLRDGVIERRQAEATCTEGGWQDVTQQDMLTINDLQFALTEQMFNLVNEQRVTVILEVAMPDDSEITRTLSTEVVIRNAF